MKIEPVTRASIQHCKLACLSEKLDVFFASGAWVNFDGTRTWPRYAVASRLMQFRAGPNEYRFHACLRCVQDLRDGNAGGGNFFATDDETVQPVDPDDEIECDLCREG